VTAWLFLCRREHRHGQAPWPGRHSGLAGRAAGPPPVALAPGPRSLDKDALHLSSPRPVAMSGPG